MSDLEIILTVLIAIVLVALAGYFAWHQRATLRSVRADTSQPAEQRRYLARQAGRRLFGSLLLLLLAVLLAGSIFLNYESIQTRGENEPITNAAKEMFRVISLYWMTTLLVLMLILLVAVMDLWATARFAHQQQKQLAVDHQMALEAELANLQMKPRRNTEPG